MKGRGVQPGALGGVVQGGGLESGRWGCLGTSFWGEELME